MRTVDTTTALKTLGMFDAGEVFWLTMDPEIEDDILDLRTSCL